VSKVQKAFDLQEITAFGAWGRFGVRHSRAAFGICTNRRETLLIQGKSKAAEDCRTPKA